MRVSRGLRIWASSTWGTAKALPVLVPGSLCVWDADDAGGAVWAAASGMSVVYAAVPAIEEICLWRFLIFVGVVR